MTFPTFLILWLTTTLNTTAYSPRGTKGCTKGWKPSGRCWRYCKGEIRAIGATPDPVAFKASNVWRSHSKAWDPPRCWRYCLGSGGPWCYTTSSWDETDCPTFNTCGDFHCTARLRQLDCVTDCTSAITVHLENTPNPLKYEEQSNPEIPISNAFQCNLVVELFQEMEQVAHYWITSQQTKSHSNFVSWNIFAVPFPPTEKLPLYRKVNRLSNYCTFFFIFHNNYAPYSELLYGLEEYSYSRSFTFILITEWQRRPSSLKIWTNIPAPVYIHLLDRITLEYHKTTNRFNLLPNIWTNLYYSKNLMKIDFSQLIVYSAESYAPWDNICPKVDKFSHKYNRPYIAKRLERCILEKHFNLTFFWMSLKSKLRDKKYAYIPSIVGKSAKTDEHNADDITGMVFSGQYHSGIIYCRKHSIFETRSAKMSIWLSPFDSLMWVFLLVLLPLQALNSLSLDAPPSNLVDIYTYQMYVLISILFRNGVRSYTERFFLFGLLSQLIPLLYESIITGKLLVPMAPDKFQYITDFVRTSYTIKYDVESHIQNILQYDPGIRHEFKKCGVLDKINVTFVLEKFSLLQDYFDNGGGTKSILVAALADEQKLQGYYTPSKDRDQLLFSQQLESVVRKVKHQHKCHLFNRGYFVPLLVFLHATPPPTRGSAQLVTQFWNLRHVGR
ncbi:hypothetical protein Fcan01_11393 [Folsomia candida]|uniref:Uncharacterized protein n=1 Tax=Folsomia candida TaxID=158441 RepID=A0A226EB69_FOLCA|nr:hypothetical protein Fcan01_11393 [Folsomia candida]